MDHDGFLAASVPPGPSPAASGPRAGLAVRGSSVGTLRIDGAVMEDDGPELKVRVSGGIAFVTTTDVRKHLTAIYERVLQKYDTVVVEKNGRPVAVLKPPSEAGPEIRVERF